MARLLHLLVLTPAQVLLDVDGLSWVKAELADGGGIGIYPGHAPLLAETLTAPLRYADPSGAHAIDLAAGILYVGSHGVMLFTSGLAGERPEAGPEPAQAAEETRFDRLARELLTTLKAQPDGVLNRPYEDEAGD